MIDFSLSSYSFPCLILWRKPFCTSHAASSGHCHLHCHKKIKSEQNSGLTCTSGLLFILSLPLSVSHTHTHTQQFYLLSASMDKTRTLLVFLLWLNVHSFRLSHPPRSQSISVLIRCSIGGAITSPFPVSIPRSLASPGTVRCDTRLCVCWSKSPRSWWWLWVCEAVWGSL